MEFCEFDKPHIVFAQKKLTPQEIKALNALLHHFFTHVGLVCKSLKGKFLIPVKAFLIKFASISSTLAFAPLGNSDHAVVSVSIDFPLNSKRDGPL